LRYRSNLFTPFLRPSVSILQAPFEQNERLLINLDRLLD
jgi:hypothetical protein